MENKMIDQMCSEENRKKGKISEFKKKKKNTSDWNLCSIHK